MNTITDIALKYYGSIDFVGKIAYENNLSLNEHVPANLIINNEGLGDETIKNYFLLNDFTPDNAKITYYPLQIQTNESSSYFLKITTWDGSPYTVYTDGIEPQTVESGQEYTRVLDGKNRVLNIAVEGDNVKIINTYGGIRFLDVDGSLDLSACHSLTYLDVSEGDISVLTYSNFFEEVEFLRIEDANLGEFDFSGIKRFKTGIDIILRNNNMTSEGVNNTLVSLDKFDYVNVGTIQLDGTNAAPTGVGVTAKTSLTTKGWTVTTN
jgi:hypothetical protein